MKRLSLFLTVVAVVALCASASQAALVSLYTFDDAVNIAANSAANAVSGAPVATLDNNVGADNAANNSLGGVVGSGSLLFRTTGNSDYAEATNLISTPASGTVTFWINSTDTTHTGTIIGAKGADTGTVSKNIFNIGFNEGTASDSAYVANSLRLQLRDGTANESGQFNVAVVPSNTVLNNGSWHQVTMAWQATTGTAGTSSLSTYVDGVFTAATGTNTLGTNHAVTFDAWTFPNYIGAIGRTGPLPTGTGPSYLDGTLDDLGVWSDLLTAGKAAALYNLGLDTLDYNAKDADVLFNLFDAATGTATTSDGKTWEYVPSGLGTTAGAVIGSAAVNLGGASGGGVQIQVVAPEPGTLGLLGAAAMGLLVFAWRKRK